MLIFPQYCIFCHTLKEKKDNSPGDLLIKQAHSDSPTIQATDEYKQRVSIDKDYSLLITGASLNDQRTFTCMVVSESNLLEYPVSVLVHSKTAVQILLLLRKQNKQTNKHMQIVCCL